MAQTSSVPTLLEIHLLGPFRVAVDGAEIKKQIWARRKPALLIKLLALQPHHQLHREQVIEFLWPDLDVEAALNNLHKSIHAARRALEPTLKSGTESNFILTHGQQVHLRAPGRLWIDVEEFEQAAAGALKSSDTSAFEKALALYDGDLLIEDPYEDWLAARREHLHTLRQDLLFNLSRLYETRGRLPQSIERLKQIVTLDSANEDAHRQLMRLYALTGDRQQALNQYQQCCDALRRELAAPPEQATQKLRAQIISGQVQPLTIDGPQSSLQTDHDRHSIAILPLANASDDPNMEYLSDGITESIINNLSQLPQLKVMARSTVFRYKGQVNPQEVGGRLGVRVVLTGRVVQSDDTLNIQTELVDVLDGAQLWGEQYTRKLSDILAVQEEIAREITENLRLRLNRGEKRRLSKRDTENIKAYQLYLHGRHHVLSQYTEESWKHAVKYFEAAITEDPAYALAYAGLSFCYLLASNLFMPPKQAKAVAESLARKALEMDDQLAEGHTCLAGIRYAHHWDWTGAEQEIQQAISLRPRYADAHWFYGVFLTNTGRFSEGLTELKQAQELDPLSLPIMIDVGWAHYVSGEYTEAKAQLQKALEIDPNNPEALVYLGRTYVSTEEFTEAISLLEKVGEVDETQWILALLGYARAASGRTDEARQMIGQLTEMSKKKYVSPMHTALIFAGLHEMDQAFLWLNKAYEERADLLVTIKVDPLFDNLRSDPRFARLLRRMGLAT